MPSQHHESRTRSPLSPLKPDAKSTLRIIVKVTLKIIARIMTAAGPTNPAVTKALKVIHQLWRRDIHHGLQFSLSVTIANSVGESQII